LLPTVAGCTVGLFPSNSNSGALFVFLFNAVPFARWECYSFFCSTFFYKFWIQNASPKRSLYLIVSWNICYLTFFRNVKYIACVCSISWIHIDERNRPTLKLTMNSLSCILQLLYALILFFIYSSLSLTLQ
jgi:hypothetical protein